MGLFSSEHPHTAVSAIINSIVENKDDDPLDGTMELVLPQLLESIQMQSSGPTELARLIRKKLKYGDVKEKLNALQIFELLVANGGKKLTPLYNDSRLLDRFKLLVTDKANNASIRRQAVLMVVGWNEEYLGNQNYRGLTDLYTQLPMQKYVKKERKRKKKTFSDFMDDEADQSTPFEVIGGGSDDDSVSDDDSRARRPLRTPRSSTLANKKKTNQQINREYKIPRINYVKERPKILLLIAESTSAATKLSNSLQTLGLNENPLRNSKCTEYFNLCRDTRRKVLRYLQLVDHEEFLGPLIHANEELISALQSYSTAGERFISDDEDDEDDFDDDSDGSDAQSYARSSLLYSSSEESLGESVAVDNFSIPKRLLPPVPPKSPRLRSPSAQVTRSINNNVVPDTQEDDDEADPFGDHKKTEFPVVWR